MWLVYIFSMSSGYPLLPADILFIDSFQTQRPPICEVKISYDSLRVEHKEPIKRPIRFKGFKETEPCAIYRCWIFS